MKLVEETENESGEKEGRKERLKLKFALGSKTFNNTKKK